MRIPSIYGFMALLVFAGTAHATPDESSTSTFAVIRNDTQIGTDTIRVERDGANSTVQTVTHVEVKLGFLTLYRFDQIETEKWADGKFEAMSSTTDDNGTVHKIDANNINGWVVLNRDGRIDRLADTAIPLNLWNAELLGRNAGFNPADGSVAKISVTDRGEEELDINGRAIRTHHYLVTTESPQDAWFDARGRLVKMLFKGRDGSTIVYRLV